jgi:hypothetical protein
MCRAKERVISGLRDFQEVAPELDKLRERLGLKGDLSTEAHHLLSLNGRKSHRPVCVLFQGDDAILEGAVILFERRLMGIGTGVLRAGDHTGDGAVIAPPETRRETLLRAVDILLQHRSFHSIFGAVSSAGQAVVVFSGDQEGTSNTATLRVVQRKLHLAGDYDAVIASFSRKMRRAIRSKRKQLEARGDLVRLSVMTPAQALDAMISLAKTSYPHRTRWEVEQRYEFLSRYPEAFSMALRLVSGEWLSFLTGWRSDGVTYVAQTMHNQRFRRESLGTVMYACLVENEVGLQQKEIEWVGGATELWSKLCEPEKCFCVTRIRPGLQSSFVRWLAERFQRNTALEYYRNELEAE